MPRLTLVNGHDLLALTDGTSHLDLENSFDSFDTADLLGGVTGQVTEDIRFEILDADGNLVDILHPLIDSTGTVACDTSNRITRQWSGLKLDPTEAAKLTAGVSRLRPVWVFSTGTEYSLGVFLFLGGTQQELAGGTWLEAAAMPDRSQQLGQKLSDDYSIAAGATLTAAISGLCSLSGITATNITTATQTSGAYLAWAGGDSTRLDVCDKVTDLLGFLPVYFDNTGTLVARPVPNPTDEWPDHVYEPGQNATVLADSVAITTNIADRPNVYLVRSTSPSGTVVAGRYDIPASQPNSAATIGYEIVARYNIDGLTSNTQANTVAFNLAQRDSQVVRTITFDAEPNPTHDTWDVVEWEGERMLEISWSLELKPGAAHRHVIKSVYQP